MVPFSRRSGLSTLKRKIVGRKKNWRSADHAKHFKVTLETKLLLVIIFLHDSTEALSGILV
jgi:hypothetical protein